jgi:amino acid adenylation domain-containing protein
VTAPAEPPRTFVDLFEHAVARHPDTPAVVTPEHQLSYAQLVSRSRRLARRLIAGGIGPEDVVAVVTDRGNGDWLTGLLGVLQAGGAYLALDPHYPAERIAFMLDDAAPKLVLHSGRLPWQARRPGLAIGAAVREETDDSAIAPADRRSVLTADNLAYLIYTSGSTGRPKGVAVTHRGMAALAATQQRVVGTGRSDQVLQWASPSFDAAFWDITLALLHGSTLHLAPPEHLMPGDPLAETIRNRGITHATLPPVALGALDADSGLLKGCTIVSTGDTCTQGIVDKWAPERTLINGYGPTETTVGATLSGPLAAGRPADIGTPFDLARVDVVGPDLDRVAPGVTGELMVGGCGVARGYHRRPRLTAERFRPDPRGATGRRVYLTGDLGYQRPDGHFHFVGRRDDQVKVRGFRIELSEIEAALVQHPDVLAAAVAVRQFRPGEDSVVAWVMAASDTADPARIRHHLGDRLPRHLIPAAIVVLDELPTNVHGKIDRSALPLPATPAGHDRDHRPEPAAAGLEGAVRALFEESLHASGIAPDDNFFDLGGDSIGYTRIIGQINREQGVRLPLREAFIHASPRGIARLAVAGTREPRPG